MKYQVNIIQNLVPIQKNRMKIHKVCILKTAPKVTKRKTMLKYILHVMYYVMYRIESYGYGTFILVCSLKTHLFG